MSRSRSAKQVVNLAAPPVIAGAAFLGLWQLFINVQGIKEVLLPSPSGIWHQIDTKFSRIFEAARHTGSNALIGLVLGIVFGLIASFIGSRFRVLSEIITPLATAVGAIPIVVLVAQFYNMFSQTSEISRRLMTAVAVFFAVYVNMVKGLTQVDRNQTELMRSYASSDFDVLRKVRLPSALPFFFTSLKVAAATSVITAFVSEYFGGLQTGLGYSITSAATVSKTSTEFAYVAAACILGLTFYLAAAALEYVAMPWRRGRRSS
jgi:NitT/TauT family transport system permease protein